MGINCRKVLKLLPKNNEESPARQAVHSTDPRDEHRRSDGTPLHPSLWGLHTGPPATGSFPRGGSDPAHREAPRNPHVPRGEQGEGRREARADAGRVAGHRRDGRQPRAGGGGDPSCPRRRQGEPPLRPNGPESRLSLRGGSCAGHRLGNARDPARRSTRTERDLAPPGRTQAMARYRPPGPSASRSACCLADRGPAGAHREQSRSAPRAFGLGPTAHFRCTRRREAGLLTRWQGCCSLPRAIPRPPGFWIST